MDPRPTESSLFAGVTTKRSASFVIREWQVFANLRELHLCCSPAGTDKAHRPKDQNDGARTKEPSLDHTKAFLTPSLYGRELQANLDLWDLSQKIFTATLTILTRLLLYDPCPRVVRSISRPTVKHCIETPAMPLSRAFNSDSQRPKTTKTSGCGPIFFMLCKDA